MKKVKLLLLSLVAVLLVACGTTRIVPITGRKQNLMVSDEQVLSLSYQEYQRFMASAIPSSNASNTLMVKRVGTRLAHAVETFFRNNGMSEELNHYRWEFNLVADKQVNAFCMPGGKIVVYAGLLPYTQNETALAIVLGHEIAHAVARHSAEQMSKQIQNNLGVQVLGGALDALGVSTTTTQIAQIVAQQGLQFRSLKFSRDHETEADKMGIIFAAMAGYDPREAIPFWKRMSVGKTNQSDLFSTHPSDSKRIAALEREMPIALQYFQQNNTSATSGKTKKRNATTKRYNNSNRTKTISVSNLYNNAL